MLLRQVRRAPARPGSPPGARHSRCGPWQNPSHVDGTLVSVRTGVVLLAAAGITAGIDLGLWPVERIAGRVR
ncbi:hypothetical protein [Crossiella cryophila]|uniref:Uncharacterized protein n=1 Tax=Crossiella cryophila TaxID=43355 RepID=A0A7W7CBK2_9PSEU|nr:hypothetical protein [Crossiella cryophila]MBB4678146.1 hypothetical protein [Crossiella cryophila]